MIPTRRCVVCFAKKAKSDLIRIVRTASPAQPDKPERKNFCVDITQKQAGRGAYICNSQDCLQKARKKRAFERSFKQNISNDIYAALETRIFQAETMTTMTTKTTMLPTKTERLQNEP